MEQIDVDRDIQKDLTTSAGERISSLLPRTSTAVHSHSRVPPPVPEDHRHHDQPSLDVQTLQVTKISDGSRMESDPRRPESGRDQTPLHKDHGGTARDHGQHIQTLEVTEVPDGSRMERDPRRPDSGRGQTLLHGRAKDHSGTGRDHGRHVHTSEFTEIPDSPRMESDLTRPECGRDRTLLHVRAKDHSSTAKDLGQHRVSPHPRARSLSPRTDPRIRFDEDGNGTGSTRSALVDQSSGEPGEGHRNVDRDKKLPFCEARMPPRSPRSDLEPSADSRSRVPADTNDMNVVPSRSTGRDRGPSADRRTVLVANNDDNSFRSRVPPRSAGRSRVPAEDSHGGDPADRDDGDRGPSDRSHSRSVSDSDNVVSSHSDRVDQQHYADSQSREFGGISSEAGDVTATTVWSEGSPEHSVYSQSGRQQSQV